MKQSEFKVCGLDCADEVKALRAELSPLPGVHDLRFDVLNARMIVMHDAAQAPEEVIRGAVARAGMQAEPWHAAERRRAEADGPKKWGRTIATSLSAALLAAGFAVHASAAGWLEALGLREAAGAAPLPARVLYGAAIAAGAWFVAPKALAAARRLRADMNLLMMVAVLGAVGLGEWLEAATVAFLFALSLALEAWSVGKARRAIAALMAISPPKARILCPGDGAEELVDVERVAPGTVVLLRPGERIPLDGEVLRGESDVNEAPITGESMPVPKHPGDIVFAGTINGDGAIEFRTTKPAGDTMLARIVRLVAEAQSRRSPSEQWVDRFARVYTPSVMALAVAVAVVPPLVLGGEWSSWFYHALVLLVIACPCALVISTPVSVVAALASAARAGVLVKGGLSLEMPAHIRAIAFDKTGTLTGGHPRVREVVPLGDWTEEHALALAASLEGRSEHPVARAIVEEARRRGVVSRPVESFQALRGRGATGLVDGKTHWIGSHRLMTEKNLETAEVRAAMRRLSGAATSVVALGDGERVLALLAVADQVRPEARAVVRALHRADIERVAMITGDNRATAEAIAADAGIDDVRAELLPEDKLAAVEALVREHRFAAMVGDGINDAPALARSSLGIAMGVAGTDAALETADVALMHDDLARIPWLIAHSRRTLRVIRQNVAFSIGVKALFVGLAVSGLATLWMAIAADMGVSLLVVFNALRLLQAEEVEG